MMLQYDLTGKWEMRKVGESDWQDAVVPGSVYADLLRNGEMADPYYRENEKEITRLSENDYEYRKKFFVPLNFLSLKHLLLRCEGLDTLCDVFLNGKKIMSAANMHRTYETEIHPYLLPGENELVFSFRSPIRYMAKKQMELALDESNECISGFSHLRKAHYMSGWDWGPKLPDMGIWRPVKLVGWQVARLDDVRLTQVHKRGAVFLTVGIRTCRDGNVPLSAGIKITAPDGKENEVSLELSDGSGEKTIAIENPELWWPNGMGSQPLYSIEVVLSAGGEKIDSRSCRIGLRTLTVRAEPDQWGKSFAFTVNGIPFFAMGGAYVPEDNLLSRVSHERTEKLLKSCAKAHFNMIRVWGGGYYPDDGFYDLCDKYGLVVWQDLMYACALYHFTDDFRENIEAETIENVRRIRHHACLGLWCGNNEMETQWLDCGWTKKFGPHLQADYIRQFEYVLPRLVKKLDPQTFYWHSSPSSGGDFDDPNGEAAGDCHYWGVWHEMEPFTAFNKHFPRFMSEFGIQSFPCLKTVKTFTLPEDRNIFSPVMEAHQKNSTANEKILHYIGETFRYPKDFDSLLFVSQLVQAEGIRYGVEHWRRNRGRCMGTLFWQINDCWPVASWSSIDYFGRWKALHYLASRFFAPVLLSAYEDGSNVRLWVTNDRKTDFQGEILWDLMDTDSRSIRTGRVPVCLGPGAVKECENLDFASFFNSSKDRRRYFFRFILKEKDGTLSENTMLFVPPKAYPFQDPKLSCKVFEEGGHYCVTIHAVKYARFVELSLRKRDVIFDDNFFDICGGEERTIKVKKESLPIPAEEIASQLCVRSLFDTYIG